MRLAILAPAYNEANTIEALVERQPRALRGIDSIVTVVVDDGSEDDTQQRAATAGAYVVRHGRNLGVAAAFRTAVQAALAHDADIAITIDADLQFDPADIPALIDPLLRGRADFVAGDRFGSRGRPPSMPGVKYYGNRAMTWAVNRLTGEHFSDVSSGYRAYSREALLHLNVQSAFTYTQETFIELAAKGLRIEHAPVSVTYYAERRSYISGNLVRYGLRTLLTIARTARDYAPLTIFGTACVALGLPGLVLGLFVLGHYALTGSFSPYIFLALASVYLVTFGAALFFLGLAADILRGIRTNQERLLYFAKKEHYAEGRHRS